MRKGKLTQAALDRLILRPLRKYHVAGTQALPGADSAGILPYILPDDRSEQFQNEFTNGNHGENLRVSTSVHELGKRFDLTPGMILISSVNSLAASGSVAISASLNLIVPEDTEDETIRNIIEQLAVTAEKLNVTIVGGHSAVSDAVSRPLLSVTAFGMAVPLRRSPLPAREKGLTGSAKVIPEEETRPADDLAGDRYQQEPGGRQPEPGDSIVMAGMAGFGGTMVLAEGGRDELLSRYPFSIVDAPVGWENELCVQTDAVKAFLAGCSACHDVSEGGVFGALWEMGERWHLGFDVDLKKIPIRQETIEICEFNDLNPYQLFGQGALLIITEKAEELCEQLTEDGRSAAVIGTMTGDKARRILNGEDVRYLEKPQQDMLWLAGQRNAG